jgi:hypothetical protein
LITSFAGLTGFRVGDRIEVHATKPLRFCLLPRGIDADATLAELGATARDFRIYQAPGSDDLAIWLEAAASPPAAAVRALAERFGAVRAEVHLLSEGALARVALLASTRGFTKLPYFHREARLAELMRGFA